MSATETGRPAALPVPRNMVRRLFRRGPARPSFWDRIADKYAASPVADPEAYDHKLRLTQAKMDPGMTVFEFGCGTGTTALTHAPHVAEVHATDVSARMIEIARRKAADASADNVVFSQASIEDWSAPDGSYDMVMGHSVLHLLEDRHAAIAKAYRLLRPGGLFVTSTTCLADRLWFLYPVLKAGRLLGYLPPVRFFTARRLARDMESAGFEVETEWQPSKSKALFLIARKPL